MCGEGSFYEPVTSFSNESHMEQAWRIFIQEEVLSDGKIPLPSDVRTVVERDHELYGPTIYWNYERNAKYVVLSREPLRKSNYVDVDRYKIHDDGRIHVPNKLNEVVRSHFLEGTRVNFMAYDEMIESDNPTVFLLSNPQFRSLLPNAAQDAVCDDTDDETLRESMMELPAFLPHP